MEVLDGCSARTPVLEGSLGPLGSSTELHGGFGGMILVASVGVYRTTSRAHHTLMIGVLRDYV